MLNTTTNPLQTPFTGLAAGILAGLRTPGTRPYSGTQTFNSRFLEQADIDVHTASAFQIKLLFVHTHERARYVGNKAKVVIPPYEIVIHDT